MNNLRCVVATIVFTLGTVGAAHSSTLRNADGTLILPDFIDAERAFQIAKEAAEVGDFSTAIVALERVLIINPELSNIKYELGLLYKRVDARQRAIYYISEALKDSEMPDDIRVRAQNDLKALSSVPVGSSGTFYGSLGLGFQFDSNADSISKFKQLNMGPLGIDTEPTNPEDIQSDYSANMSAAVGYRKLFGKTGSSVWNSGLKTSISRFDQLTGKNGESIGIETSISYPVRGVSDDGASVRYSHSASMGWSLSEGELDSNSHGLGFELSKSSKAYTSAVAFNAGMSVDNDLDGSEANEFQLGMSTNSNFIVGENMASLIGLSISNNNAKSDVSSYSKIGLSFGLSRRIESALLNRPAVVNFNWNLSEKSYHAENLDINPELKRIDRASILSVEISVPLLKSMQLRSGLSYTDNQSNLPNFEYDNTKGTFGLTWNF